MVEIDPLRTDLIAKFQNNPGEPHNRELRLLVKRLRLMPLAQRHVLVCTRRGRE